MGLADTKTALASTTNTQRLTVFFLIYLSYLSCYLTRKNYSVWLNAIVSLGLLTKQQVSIYGSMMESSYGAGKFVSGPFVDVSSPSKVLVGSVLIAALCNLAIFQVDVFWLNVSVWGLNGLVQAAAWPALVVIFLNWFNDSPSKGTFYAILSTSQNVGSALCPILLSPLVDRFGWKSATVVPGVAGVVCAFVLLAFLGDGPAQAPKKPNASDTSFFSIVTSRTIWLLGVAYGALTIVRVCAADWSFVFLAEVHGFSNDMAVQALVMLEVGGFFGGVLAGWLSDRWGSDNRCPTMILMSVLLVPLSTAIVCAPLPTGFERPTMLFLYFVVGLLTFGPHMLIGLVAREVFPDSPSTAGSLTKSIGQMGGSIAGYPVGLLSTSYGWWAVGYLWGAVMSVATVCFSVLYFDIERARSKRKTE